MRYILETFGCQMNKSRSEHLEYLLQVAGHQEASAGEPADILLFNTCAVREHASHKALSVINRMIADYGEGSEPIVVVFGCLAELLREQIVRRVPRVRIVAGTRNIDQLPRLIQSQTEKRTRTISLDHSESPSFRERGYRRKKGISTYLPITYGCNNSCSYCVVPHTTGRQTSKPLDLIREELGAIQQEGFREIILLGQNVNSYGTDLAPALNFETLLEVVEERLAGTGIWVRFLTSHPRDMRRSIVEAVRVSEVICPYFHFPLQSGSDRVLERMNRGYTRKSYQDMVLLIRHTIPQAGIGTDIIVGFPGETDADFMESLEVAQEAEFDIAYTYTYSPRPGTEASRWEDDVPQFVKKKRLFALNELVRTLHRQKIGSLQGQESMVLVEHNGRELVGKTPGNRKVYLSGETGLKPGETCRVRFGESNKGRLVGSVIDHE